jgi:hypothetical protein
MRTPKPKHKLARLDRSPLSGILKDEPEVAARKGLLTILLTTQESSKAIDEKAFEKLVTTELKTIVGFIRQWNRAKGRPFDDDITKAALFKEQGMNWDEIMGAVRPDLNDRDEYTQEINRRAMRDAVRKRKTAKPKEPERTLPTKKRKND